MSQHDKVHAKLIVSLSNPEPQSAGTVDTSTKALPCYPPGNLEVDWTDPDWQTLLMGGGHARRPQKEAATDSDSDDLAPAACPEQSERTNCTCLRRLTSLLCDLNYIERQQDGIICMGKTLDRSTKVLACTDKVLSCHSCRYNCKVLLFTVTVLQTVLNWIRVDHIRATGGRGLPAILFGNWQVPETDAHLIKRLLTSRILVTGDALVHRLRLRVDEIVVHSGKSGLNYQSMDIESLQQGLLRLNTLLRELTGRIQPLDANLLETVRNERPTQTMMPHHPMHL